MEYNYPKFTPEMKQTHTILIPNMAITQFRLLEYALHYDGYKCEILGNCGSAVAQLGLKYVHNDTCYPALLVIGQFLDALNSGKYDLDHTALLITQTGGGCRASNYIKLLRKALVKAGYGNIPVASLNFSGLEKGSGLPLTLPLLRKVIASIFYGDLLMQCLYRTRPYECEPGAANRLFDHWMARCQAQIYEGEKAGRFKKTVQEIVDDFDNLPLQGEGTKPRVGVVGEILVKFHPTANNQVVDVIEAEGCEAVVPGLAEFFMFGIAGSIFQKDPLGRSKKGAIGARAGLKMLYHLRKPMDDALRKSSRFEPSTNIYELAEYAEEILSLCNSMGEGWLLTAEMVELILNGAPNIVCAQPFACLPNHVVGKSVIKELRRRYAGTNIVAVDYDPGASEVNQLNRIKLMISVAKANLAEQQLAERPERKAPSQVLFSDTLALQSEPDKVEDYEVTELTSSAKE